MKKYNHFAHFFYIGGKKGGGGGSGSYGAPAQNSGYGAPKPSYGSGGGQGGGGGGLFNGLPGLGGKKLWWIYYQFFGIMVFYISTTTKKL